MVAASPRHQFYDQRYVNAYRARSAISYADKLSHSIETLAERLLLSDPADYRTQSGWDNDFKEWERLLAKYKRHAQLWMEFDRDPMGLTPREYELAEMSPPEGSAAAGNIHAYKTLTLSAEKYAVLKRGLMLTLASRAGRPPFW